MIEQKYNLNMIPDKVPVMVRVSQYDQYSREIIFSLYDGALEYEIPTGSTISVRGTKPDHTGFEYPCEFEGNEVSFKIEPQQTILEGLVPCEIRITSNNQIVGSCNFIINVEPTPLDESTVISDTDLPLIEEASQAAVIAQGAAASAEASAEQAEAVLSTAVKSVNNTLPDSSGNVDVVALPDGGTTGQILTKQSSTDGDADWEDPLLNYEITATTPSSTPINADLLQGHNASYFATKNDLSLAQTNLADSEVSPSAHTYSVGQYLVYNGQLYRVKTAISVGENLVVGTNIETTSIGDELKTYTLVNDNGWKVKKYNDGTYEAWYPYTNSNTTTATQAFKDWYITGDLSITLPSISLTTYHYQLNASFTTKYSFPIFWQSGNKLFYKILADSSTSTASSYRLSAYNTGTWR